MGRAVVARGARGETVENNPARTAMRNGTVRIITMTTRRRNLSGCGNAVS